MLLFPDDLGGGPAGYLTASGYRRVHMLSHSYAEHRLIWKIVYGKDPKGFVDHINGVRDDNRIENLRDVTPQGNSMNMVRGRWLAETARRKAEKQATADLLQQQRMAARLKRKAQQQAKFDEALASHFGEVLAM